MLSTQNAKRIRAQIIDERMKYPAFEAARLPGDIDQIKNLFLSPSIVVEGEQPGGDPAHNIILGEVEFPADADISTVQVWLPRTNDRGGPYWGAIDCPQGNGRNPFVISVSNLLDVASNPANASLGITVIRDDRAKSE